MKYMVISDIHGDINNLNKVLDIYWEEKCSKLLILGDLFNYGIDYNRYDIINRLNTISDKIIAVSGNCDNNISGLLFSMPYEIEIKLNNSQVILTHGHLYSKEHLLKTSNDIIFIGHSHVSKIEKINNKLIVNPGSIARARRGENSFAIVDENSITIRNLDNIILDEYKLKY